MNPNSASSITRRSPLAINRHALGSFRKEPSHQRTELLRSSSVDSRGLQNALLFILALYASMALLNLGTEMNSLIQIWHSFVDFLATGLFLP